jgi:hypothetical protein
MTQALAFLDIGQPCAHRRTGTRCYSCQRRPNPCLRRCLDIQKRLPPLEAALQRLGFCRKADIPGLALSNHARHPGLVGPLTPDLPAHTGGP